MLDRKTTEGVIKMDVLRGVIVVLIFIIIGMLFGRIMVIAGLIIEAIVKFFRKLF
ncbi:hypothetical protein [Clostridium sp. DL-VIII]|uniref:hypothetical protein n=1 Tax=Clostridium sp. DL-VIII TaxID=641107 RepID=UPI00163EE854|nr:hypothetical protein [Clostridium sp. DL-VIII]